MSEHQFIKMLVLHVEITYNRSAPLGHEMDLISFCYVVYYTLGLMSNLYAYFSVNLHFFCTRCSTSYEAMGRNAKDVSSYIEHCQHGFNGLARRKLSY